MDSIKDDLKALIIKSLRITDVAPGELRDDQPLLGGDLEIDSIDVLQLILEIEKHFGIQLVTGRFDRSAWDNVNSLAAAIETRMKEAQQA